MHIDVALFLQFMQARDIGELHHGTEHCAVGRQDRRRAGGQPERLLGTMRGHHHPAHRLATQRAIGRQVLLREGTAVKRLQAQQGHALIVREPRVVVFETKHVLGEVIHAPNAAVRRVDDIAIGNGVNRRVQLGQQSLALLGGAPLRGDVLLHRQVVRDYPASVTNRRDGSGFPVELAILSLVAEDAAPLTAGADRPPELRIDFRRCHARFEQAWRGAQHFVHGVAGDFRQLRIGVDNAGLRIGDDDRRRTLLDRALKKAQLLFRPPAFRHVENDGVQQRLSAHHNRPGIRLHIARLAAGQPVAEQKMPAFFRFGARHLRGDLGPRQRVNRANVHAAERI
ncbi:MAG: hypothetical protein BWY76_03182 [bacterium ADurb.Bin429]|nr:MAG: hypothetical protein BWY76_03182 [bacterium ADurb.Bin429]